MPAGYNALLTKTTIDDTLGRATQAVNKAFLDVEAAKRFVDPAQDAELVALGYTPEDVANIRSALGDLDQLRIIYEGGAALATAKDFRTFAQRLYGTGYLGY